MTTLLLLQLAAVTWTVQVSATMPIRPAPTPIAPYTITRVTAIGSGVLDPFVQALCDQPSPFTKPYGGVYTHPPVDAVLPEQLVFDDPVELGRICVLDLRLLMVYLPKGSWVIALLRTAPDGTVPIKQIAPMFHKP